MINDVFNTLTIKKPKFFLKGAWILRKYFLVQQTSQIKSHGKHRIGDVLEMQ